jgi:hypothetical protein
MAIVLTAKITGFAALKPTQLKPLMHKALVDVGYRWRDKYLPGHFINAASRKYGYLPRQGERGSGRSHRGSYTWRKLREKKHSRPLVWSGRSRDESIRTRGIKALGSMKTARVRVTVSKGFNRRHPKSKIRMGEEVTRVLPSEAKDLSEFLVSRLEYHIAKAGKKAVRRTAA